MLGGAVELLTNGWGIVLVASRVIAAEDSIANEWFYGKKSSAMEI